MIQTQNLNQITLTDPEKVDLFWKNDGLSLQSLYFALYNKFPSLYAFKPDELHMSWTFNTKLILEDIKKMYPEEEIQVVLYTIYNIQKKKEFVGINLILPNKKIMARFEASVTESYILYECGNEEEVEKLVELALNHFEKPELPPNNVYTVAYDNCFYLNKLPIKDFSGLDLNKNYNDDFVQESEKIENFIKEDDVSGLLILHGEKGTGKSTYIRHLISTNSEKKFVYIPSNLVDIFGQPTFSSFLMTLQNHIIIMEDCEGAIKDRKSNGTPEAVSLLLNLTDGLLSDGLGLKFLCTFNDDVKNIDSALLRKGRLVSKYEFETLCTEKTNALLKELYQEKWENGEVPTEPVSDKPLSLADIYNFYNTSYEKERKKII